MNHQEKSKTNVEVIPVIEIALKSFYPPANSEAGLFASKYLEAGKTGKFLETPDGWFFPLDYLLTDIQSFGNFLLLESTACGEFEIGGGFQILVDGKSFSSISVGSSFRFTTDIANWIASVEENQTRTINIDNDRALSFRSEDNELTIWCPGHLNGYLTISSFQEQIREIKVPLFEVKEKCRFAQKLIRDFAGAIELSLVSHGNDKITPEMVRFMFGLK